MSRAGHGRDPLINTNWKLSNLIHIVNIYVYKLISNNIAMMLLLRYPIRYQSRTCIWRLFFLPNLWVHGKHRNWCWFLRGQRISESWDSGNKGRHVREGKQPSFTFYNLPEIPSIFIYFCLICCITVFIWVLVVAVAVEGWHRISIPTFKYWTKCGS